LIISDTPPINYGSYKRGIEMSDEQQVTPASEPTSSAPQPSRPQNPEETVDYWKSKYNGGLGHANRLKNQIDELMAKHQGAEELSQTLAARETELSGKVADLTKQVEDLRLQAEQSALKAEKLEKRQTLGRQIRGKYPDLAELYEEGFLTGVEGLDEGELDDYLSRYAEKLGVVKEKMVKDATSGSTPPPPSSDSRTTPVVTIGEAKVGLDNAVRVHGINSPEYQRAMEVYKNTIGSITDNG
jgi:hypothetical protein